MYPDPSHSWKKVRDCLHFNPAPHPSLSSPPSLPFWLPAYLLLPEIPIAQTCLLLHLPHYATIVSARPLFYAIFFCSGAECRTPSEWRPWPGFEWRSWPADTKALTYMRMEGLASAQTEALGEVQIEVLFIPVQKKAV